MSETIFTNFPLNHGMIDWLHNHVQSKFLTSTPLLGLCHSGLLSKSIQSRALQKGKYRKSKLALGFSKYSSREAFLFNKSIQN